MPKVANQHKLKNYPRVDFSKIPEWKKGYLAGFIDGEGSIIIPKARNLRVGIFISNTDPFVLEWCLNNFPFGSLRLVKRKPRPNHPNEKQAYQFYAQGTNNVYQILKELIPYLIIKKAKAIECIRLLEEKYGKKLQYYVKSFTVNKELPDTDIYGVPRRDNGKY